MLAQFLKKTLIKDLKIILKTLHNGIVPINQVNKISKIQLI